MSLKNILFSSKDLFATEDTFRMSVSLFLASYEQALAVNKEKGEHCREAVIRKTGDSRMAPLYSNKKKIFGHRWLIKRLGLRKKKTYITSNNNKSSEKMRVAGIGKSIPATAHPSRNRVDSRGKGHRQIIGVRRMRDLCLTQRPQPPPCLSPAFRL